MPSSPPFVGRHALAAGGGAGGGDEVSVAVVVVSAVVVSAGAGSVPGAGVGPADSAPSSPQPVAVTSARRAKDVAKSVLTVVSFIGRSPMMACGRYGAGSPS